MLTLPSPRSSLILIGVALLAAAATTGARSADTAATGDGLAPASPSITRGTAVPGETTAPSDSATSAPAPATASVTIADHTFSPADAVVAAGGTIEWTNADGLAHTVTSASGAFDSGFLPDGATFSQAFETPGRYDYACAIHPEMHGTVTVTEPATAPPSPAPGASAVPAVATEVPVAIVHMGYDPAAVEVPVGATVRWTNDDSVVHTVTAQDGSFNSGIMRSGVDYSLVFEKPGTYDYFCAVHPQMRASVVVTDPGG